MTVLIVNAELGVRRRTGVVYDPHGAKLPGGHGPMAGPWPGMLRERSENGTLRLSMDDRAWPVRVGDLIIDVTNHAEYLVTQAGLMRHEIVPEINYVRVEASERVGGSTEPGGPEYAGSR